MLCIHRRAAGLDVACDLWQELLRRWMRTAAATFVRGERQCCPSWVELGTVVLEWPDHISAQAQASVQTDSANSHRPATVHSLD